LHVEAAEGVGRGECLLNRRHEGRTREVVAQRAAVDVPLARSRLHVHAADAFLAASDGVNGALGHHSVSLLRLSTTGCWAACGCCASGYTRSLRRSFCRPSAFLGSMPNTAFSMTRSGCLESMEANGV